MNLNTIAEVKRPAFADVPRSEVFFADTHDSIGPLGAKAQGECAIMNVRVWLRGLGLGRYENNFRANKIDFDVLADLTEDEQAEVRAHAGPLTSWLD